ncbi:MAG: efflux RND transporter periplasmic adaptor subunit [Immundisolibacter sp.]|uniref:efflux RND transporter periplasmic adaptor subunit n=1 Tax=Immundisolibacter sp. TaxID=1934948 RepID=UPI003EE34BD7
MRRLLLPSVVLGLLLAGQAQGTDEAVPVSVAEIEQTQSGVRLVLPGTVLARRSATLSVEMAGLVAELAVDEGDTVQAGDLLLRLRDRPQALALQAARAEARRALAAAELADVQERRQTQLVSQKMTPQDNYDQARAQRRQAQAEHAAANARVALLEDELARHALKAPFDGVISRKHTELGSWVQPTDGVLDLVETAALRVEFALPQVHYAEVRPGTPVELRFDAVPGDPIAASVSRLIPVGHEAARSFRVRVELPNPDQRYAPGMSVDVTVATANDAAVPIATVPADALVRRADGGAVLWTVQGQGNSLSATPVPVQPGRAFGDRIELRGTDLPIGTRVVVHGNERLRPGQALRIVGGS